MNPGCTAAVPSPGTSPRVSVVLGVHNHADRLSDTLDSVLAQRLRDFECVVVDDGSTEPGVREVLDRYAGRDSRIRVSSAPHRGLTRALMVGCAAARGAYIARVDVGDALHPHRLDRQCAEMEAQPATAFVSCWTEVCGPAWEPLYVECGQPTGPEGDDVLPRETGGNLTNGPTHHGSVMFRRAAYIAAGGYRPQFYFGQDWDLWYRLAERGRFRIVPEILYRVRLFPDSLSARHRRQQAEIGRCSLGAFGRRRQGLSEDDCLVAAERIRPAAPNRHRRPNGEGAHFIGGLLRKNGDARCRRYFLQALRERPWRMNTWCRLLQALAGGLR